MILMSTCLLGEVPFKNVYLHGLVRDSKGRKISKSLGNNIDPLDVIAKYGADAARMSLIIGTAPGNDSKISDEKLKAYKHFANKLWNISRFVLEQTGSQTNPEKSLRSHGAGADFTRLRLWLRTGAAQTIAENILTIQDKELWLEFENLKKDITSDLENFKFYLAGEKIYHYVWHRFADIILEESKQIFARGSVAEQNSRKWTLFKILKDSLKILHPFMPFITEEIWSMLPVKNKSLLLIEKWPLNN